MTVRDVQSPARLTWPGFPGVPDDAIDRLMGPGAPFEMELEQVGQRRLEVFVRRPRSLRQMLDETVASRPDLPFLVAPDRTWTFAEGRSEIDAIAALLADEYAIGRGDRVAIVAANSPAYGLVMWATLSLGAVVSSLNGWWTGPELEHGIELSSPKLIAGDAPRLARLEGAAVPPHVPVRRLDELRQAAVARPAPAVPPSAEVVEDDPAVILFTSGTTGRAKGATLSHRNIINFVMTGKLGTALGEMFVPATAGAQPATLLASPMFHVSGMLGILMSGGGLGAKLVFPPPGRWDPTAYLELTARHGISTWTGVPTQFWRLLRHEHLDDYDLHCVTTVGSGGAPFPPELVRALTERMPWVTLSNGYGMSETVGIGTRVVGPMMVAHPDSVGPANIGTEVEIRDVGGGPVLSEGDVGEIYLRSPSVFLGYWDNEAATSACLDAEGWYRTGDFGRIQDGMLYLDSRMRDMVLRGGENIYPIEIEHRLIEHPEIDDAAVIGVDHPELGQEVKAFVVRSPGSTLSEREVKEWAARSLAAFKVPAHVEFRTALPYTETGKVLKHELEQEERSRRVEAVAMTLVREHFIRKLGLSTVALDGEVSHLQIGVGSTRCDLGLIATVADVIGGMHIMRQRGPAEAATTHLEAIAIDRLVGPGELAATATTLTASRRRAIVEVRFHLGDTTALVHVGFALRAVPEMADVSGSQWRDEVDAIDRPLYEVIGVEVAGDVARVQLEPHLFNHVEALQGGAMAALLEAAAIGDRSRPPRRVAQATVTYLSQARHDEIVATADRSMGDDLVVVDAHAGTTHATRAVMALTDP